MARRVSDAGGKPQTVWVSALQRVKCREDVRVGTHDGELVYWFRAEHKTQDIPLRAANGGPR